MQEHEEIGRNDRAEGKKLKSKMVTTGEEWQRRRFRRHVIQDGHRVTLPGRQVSQTSSFHSTSRLPRGDVVRQQLSVLLQHLHHRTNLIVQPAPVALLNAPMLAVADVPPAGHICRHSLSWLVVYRVSELANFSGSLRKRPDRSDSSCSTGSVLHYFQANKIWEDPSLILCVNPYYTNVKPVRRVLKPSSFPLESAARLSPSPDDPRLSPPAQDDNYNSLADRSAPTFASSPTPEGYWNILHARRVTSSRSAFAPLAGPIITERRRAAVTSHRAPSTSRLAPVRLPHVSSTPLVWVSPRGGLVCQGSSSSLHPVLVDSGTSQAKAVHVSGRSGTSESLRAATTRGAACRFLPRRDLVLQNVKAECEVRQDEEARVECVGSDPELRTVWALFPGWVAPGFPHVGIVSDDAAGRQVISGLSRFPRPCIPAELHTLFRAYSQRGDKSYSLFSREDPALQRRYYTIPDSVKHCERSTIATVYGLVWRPSWHFPPCRASFRTWPITLQFQSGDPPRGYYLKRVDEETEKDASILIYIRKVSCNIGLMGDKAWPVLNRSPRRTNGDRGPLICLGSSVFVVRVGPMIDEHRFVTMEYR
ncbi:hypothetical protein PR048_021318 [Dryococelus australis]|uniref:Uncharacterized protein n=1 Tax=Dryococelus australis TaxID=614101 RepID=A0ABQ9GXV2_9NEOP|nr:hypothetical protein PR048_021318 [Dryococelus australis]